MAKSVLPKGAIKLIGSAVDRVFDRVLARFLEHPPVDKRIYIGYKPRVTLPSLFRAAAVDESVKPDKVVLDALMEIARGFLDAQRERTKAQVVKSVASFLAEAEAGGVDTDVERVLSGDLHDVWRKAENDVKKILDTEASTARNTGTLDGIVKVNAISGIEDPVVFFVVVRDSSLCDECKRLHLMDDNTTPRCWYLSEVKHGYHKPSDDVPSISGLHPHCRCSLVTLMPGYGFDKGGMVTWISLDHDEISKQRGVAKREYDWGEALFKSVNGDWRQDPGYTFHVDSDTLPQFHLMTVNHNGVKVGHLAYKKWHTVSPVDGTQEGYHEVEKSHLSPEHRGKGLYKEMLHRAAAHVHSLDPSSKGVMSRHFQRSDDATQAWARTGSFQDREAVYLNAPGFKNTWEK